MAVVWDFQQTTFLIKVITVTLIIIITIITRRDKKAEVLRWLTERSSKETALILMH